METIQGSLFLPNDPQKPSTASPLHTLWKAILIPTVRAPPRFNVWVSHVVQRLKVSGYIRSRNPLESNPPIPAYVQDPGTGQNPSAQDWCDMAWFFKTACAPSWLCGRRVASGSSLGVVCFRVVGSIGSGCTVCSGLVWGLYIQSIYGIGREDVPFGISSVCYIQGLGQGL